MKLREKGKKFTWSVHRRRPGPQLKPPLSQIAPLELKWNETRKNLLKSFLHFLCNYILTLCWFHLSFEWSRSTGNFHKLDHVDPRVRKF